MKKAILLLLILLIATTATAQEIIYPTTIGGLTAQATLSGHGSVSGLKEGEEARLETITFPETEFQKISIVKEALYINGKTIYPQYILDEFGNKYLLFHIKENGEFNYEIIADINRRAMAFDTTEYEITQPPETVANYIKPSQTVESNSTEILTITNNKIRGNNFISTINQTVDWVNNYVEYASGNDFRKYYLEQKSAIETLISKKGVCDEFTNLATAILRAKKIPTRIAIGLTYDGLEWGNHAWLESYHTQLKKWVPSDPTFREAGFIDAMHIKMGSFDDVTSSNAKCYYPSTAKCSIDSQGELPQVTIIDKQYTDNVKLESNIKSLKSNAWNDVNVAITNKTTSTISAPIKIRDITDVLIQDKKQSVILSPGETKNITFRIMPRINLTQNQIAKGTLVFNSLSKPYEKEITVTPNDLAAAGEITLDDVTPIAHEGTLKIQITVSNYFGDDQQVKTSIKSADYDQTANTTIPALSTKIITNDIQNYSVQPYDINVVTNEKIFLTQIIPVKTKLTAVTEPVKQTIIEQKIPQQANIQGGGSQFSLNNPVAIVIGLLAGIVVLLFGLFLVNKRYV